MGTLQGAKRHAVLLALLDEMSQRGSWSGETHVQKAVYFLQKALDAPLGFEFVLYKHGPFSFDLRQELGEMRANRLIQVMPQPFPYGPSLAPGPSAGALKRWFPKTIAKFQPKIRFVAENFASRGVTDLERLGAALYVTQEDSKGAPLQARARRLHDLKPHISLEQAKSALAEVDEILSEARSAGV
jgi:hypothetical protein